MPRERTIKGPVKRGTITERQARTVAKEILEERYGKQERHSKQGRYHTVVRDAKTGRFITVKEAERRKATAIVETIKRPKKKK